MERKVQKKKRKEKKKGMQVVNVYNKEGKQICKNNTI